ncbi:MAG: PrsW family intramembrane metalloprotease [Lachnospiraceae bacterium]|nr:PrsW family intramembrane metalloprotease [Lachnospiraceae bacterium]MBQ6353880.1 PrsW family intramembrane metalloprotease [Lachnospiraceae bacterium]
MDNLNYIVFICIVVALGMMLPLLERKTRGVVIFVITGVCCCLFISEVNNIILNALDNDLRYVTTNLTPITEEIVKALPILYCATVITDDRRTLIMNAFAVGVGFALLENMIVLLQSVENVTILWALVRGFGSGLVHGLCTVMVGYGISYLRKRRKLFWCGTFALLSAAITYHAVYNVLVQSQFRMAGILLPALSYIPAIWFVRKSISQRTTKTAGVKA